MVVSMRLRFLSFVACALLWTQHGILPGASAGLQESPVLAPLVAEKKLPPVDLRVPSEPAVAKPLPVLARLTLVDEPMISHTT
jgi:hypothetical protein